MSKFLYWQDGHNKVKNSINRTGNYFSDWLLKFDELLSIGIKNEVKAILDGGDMLHAAEPSYRVIDEIADRVEKAKIPMYSLLGNHAERYGHIENSNYAGLSHLQKRSEYFKYFDSNYLRNGIQRGFTIQGYEYFHGIEESLKETGIIFDDKYKDSWKIAIVHAFVCPKPFQYASHIVCDDIKTNADLVLVAHYHSQWEKKVENTQFLDIGCFGRNSITEANIEPSCVLLDTDKRTYEVIKLTSAKPGIEVFDFNKKTMKDIKEGNLDEFISSLESVSFQGGRIENIIKEIGEKNNIDKAIIDLIINKIGELSNGL